MKRMHIFVAGRVQGVFFRASTEKIARSLHLGGWVRNLADGGVEIVCEGNDADVDALLAWCRQGPPSAHVTHVEVSEEPSTGEFSGFTIRH